jgi:hypothetical protein
MKKFASFLPLVAVVVIASVAWAGVVLDEQEILQQPNGSKVTRNRTVMIEGDKQKSIIDNGARTVITDLDKGTMTMVDGTHKRYAEFAFPPGRMMGMKGAVSPTITFKKTGGQDKIIGYSCDEYTGAGTIGPNPVSLSGCFSDSAPGAADYNKFQREMKDKVKGTTMANMGEFPDGVPLRLKITTTLAGPAGGNKPNQKLPPREFVTDTTVAKITASDLPADSFQVPAGYQKQEMPPMMMGGRAPAAPGARKNLPQ